MHKQRRAHQQDHRQCHLRGHQSPRDAGGAAIAARLGRARPEYGARIDADGSDDRREAERDRRNANSAHREREHAAVDAKRHRHRLVAGREQPHEQIGGPTREE